MEASSSMPVSSASKGDQVLRTVHVAGEQPGRTPQGVAAGSDKLIKTHRREATGLHHHLIHG